MRNVTHLGRVSALAISLGLGMAIANSPVIALAGPGGSSSTDSSGSSSSGSTSSSSTNSGAQPKPSIDPGPAGLQATSGATTSMPEQDSRLSVEAAKPRSHISRRTSTSAKRDRNSAAVSPRRGPTTLNFRLGAANDTASSKSVTSLPERPAAVSFSSRSTSPMVTANVAPAVATASSHANTPAVVTPTAPATLSPRRTAGDTVTKLVSGLLSAIGFNPQAASGPAVPAQAPALWTLLAWVRREIDQTVFPNVAVAATTSLVQSPNLLTNPGAEFGDPSLSGFSSVTIPGWTVTGTPTVIQYNTKVRLPWPLGSPGPTLPAFLGFPTSQKAPLDSGIQFFGGGNVATSTLTQTLNLGDAASPIDAGNMPYTLSAALGGKGLQRSAASVTVNFLDENHLYLGSGTIAPVTPFNRLFRTSLLERQTSGTIPAQTRFAQVVVTFKDYRNYNNAYADNMSFTVGDSDLTAPPPPTPPVPTVGSLDHVFMVYLENKGFDDIVGSPNAPYLNSIINANGLASNYYALTHPSLPNYYPILGGSDFGINYNCTSDCFDEPNLVDEIEAAHETWAAYEQNGGGDTSPGQLPFLAFHDIFNNPARVAHLLPLTQMAPDLSSPATTPNFAWFEPDEDHNGEGPIDTLLGALSFALTQVTNHQYNVKAADQFLQDTLPTILNSPVWQDPTQKSAIFITFDEDNNNLSLGFGNQGNHIVTVVIPSPGAVANGGLPGGMRPGPFVATDYYNHYSLQRTIEDALGLDPLTNNDLYAQPMNEFWS